MNVHWKYSLKFFFLPLLGELCGLFEISYLSLFSRSDLQQVRKWVAAAVSLTHHPRCPRLWFTAASALVCSFVIFLELSVGDYILLGFRRSAFEFGGSLARFLHFSTSCFQISTRIGNVSARCIAQGQFVNFLNPQPCFHSFLEPFSKQLRTAFHPSFIKTPHGSLRRPRTPPPRFSKTA